MLTHLIVAAARALQAPDGVNERVEVGSGVIDGYCLVIVRCLMQGLRVGGNGLLQLLQLVFSAMGALETHPERVDHTDQWPEYARFLWIRKLGNHLPVHGFSVRSYQMLNTLFQLPVRQSERLPL